MLDAKPLFADEAAYQSYVDALRSSGNYDVIKGHALKTSIIRGDQQVTIKGDNVWQVKFPAEINYSGPLNMRQCLEVTADVVSKGSELTLHHVISEKGECLDNRSE